MTGNIWMPNVCLAVACANKTNSFVSLGSGDWAQQRNAGTSRPHRFIEAKPIGRTLHVLLIVHKLQPFLRNDGPKIFKVSIWVVFSSVEDDGGRAEWMGFLRSK